MPMFKACKFHPVPFYFDADETGGFCPQCGAVANLLPAYVKDHDNVNSPIHYSHSEIECIDAMLAAFGKEDVETYCRIAAFKYLWRHKYKGKAEDIDKAVWYLRFSRGDDPRGANGNRQQ